MLKYLSSFLLGSLLTLAFAPFDLLPVVPLSFSGFLFLHEYVLRTPNIKRKKLFYIGWWFGMGHYITSLYWVANPLLVEPEKFAWLIPFALTLIPAILSLYYGLTSVLLRRSWSRTTRALVFALVVVVNEIARVNFIIPFSWNLLGYTLSNHEKLAQVGWLVGIYGASLLVALGGVVLYTRNLIIIGLMATIYVVTWGYGYIRLEDTTIEYHSDLIRIVQPNFDQPNLGDRIKQREYLKELIDMTTKNNEGVKVVIWPEAAFPFGIWEDSPWINVIASAAPHDGVIITGTDRYEVEGEKITKAYNSLVIINSKAELIRAYDKQILVPFGEYIPFKRFIPFIEKVTHGTIDFSIGSLPQVVTEVPGLPPFLALICYEVIFNQFPKDPPYNLLLNTTNDIWLGKSIGPLQHLAMARFRAIEMGIPILRVASTGVSALIGSKGQMLKKIDLNHKAVLDIYLPRG
jgi:apolipoprotein N-acyltransferase